MRRTPTALTALLLAAAPLTACSAEPSVDQRAVEAEVGERVENRYGAVPDDVTCPSDLRGDVDVTMTCFVTFNGVELDAEVQITEVLDDTLDFRVTLPDEFEDPLGE
jgi:hypothetical protein